MKILFFLFSFPVLSLAAPHPGASGSALSNPTTKLWLSPKNYSITLPFGEWRFTERNSQLVRVVNPLHPTFTFSLSESPQLNSKSPESEYTNLGFEVLNRSSARLGKDKKIVGTVFDLIHRVENKQVRQVLVMHQKKTLALTCSGTVSKFLSDGRLCNDIVNTLDLRDSNGH